jgi:hypothetical protein
MDEAPRDGSFILAIVGENDNRHMAHLKGRAFVIRREVSLSGFDSGWAVFPGFGGAPDQYFSHWMPLPPPPTEGDA